MKSLLIANRGEIAIRIARAAAEIGLETVAVFSPDDARSLHVRATERAIELPGQGPAAYLAIDAILAAAVASDCDAIHPGYGFLSENAAFARACAEAGITFVGPSPEALTLFGDKPAAKRFAQDLGVPVLEGIDGGDVAAANAFLRSLPSGVAVMVKASAGGGGRGIRLVRDPADLPPALQACAAEASAAFGSSAVFVERFLARARHIEVQVLADSEGSVATLGERECTLQRRNQKLIEVAPAPGFNEGLRDRLVAAARDLIEASRYQGLATVEFLIDRDVPPDDGHAFAFIEVNPRLQVEHTVTEEVTGVDLVKASLRIAAGSTLQALGLHGPHAVHGSAIQLRINAEILGEDDQVRPAYGTLTAYDPPSGPGVRIDGAGYAGYTINPRFDSLLTKVIVWGDDFTSALRRAQRALGDFRIAGIATNAPLLQAVLRRSEFADATIDTRWLERVLPELLSAEVGPARYFSGTDINPGVDRATREPEGAVGVRSPLTGVVVSMDVAPGDKVHSGQHVAVLEALKMQHLVTAEVTGIVLSHAVAAGELVKENAYLLFVTPADLGPIEARCEFIVDPDERREDLAELEARLSLTLDVNRPGAVARRRHRNQRTARENLADLFDEGSFTEFGALAIASHLRGTVQELMRNTPGDGIVTGVGTVNAGEFGEDGAKCAGLAYDFTVLAGTQGRVNHAKTDRLFQVIERLELPTVFYCEGGGGRPGDGSVTRESIGLAGETFESFARISGKAPRIGIASGRCFAGNAVLLGCCDIIVATEDSNIGLGGPAVIEGAGLGAYSADDIGAIDVQWTNGVVDIRAADEAEATAVTKTILSYFQGRLANPGYADQRLLRHVVPENRLRVFDIRRAITLLADTDSWREVRGGFGQGMITGFIRIDGRPMGLIANDCRRLSGVIVADGCDKAAHFMRLCDSFGLPIAVLCDTPGFMVGPEAEKTATVRKGARMFVTAAALSVPMFTVVIRKCYGLGAMAMAGGSLHSSTFTIAWPTGEFGGMGLEGAVRLGHRRELEAIEDPTAREARYQALVAGLYDNGKAVTVAQFVDIDAVIDPADTRAWLMRGLAASPVTRGSRRYVDTW